MAYLSFYEGINAIGHPSASQSYVENKHAYPQKLVRSQADTPNYYKFFPESEYIPMPPTQGQIQLLIYNRLVIPTTTGLPDDNNTGMTYLADCKWIFLNDIKLELMDKYYRTLPNNDVEISAFIEPEAEESLNIETYAGTLQTDHPLARGLVLLADGIVRQCTRAGYTAPLEHLLCGTAFSQYRGRKKSLTGTASTPYLSSPTSGGWGPLTDSSDPSGIYLIASEVQDLITNQSNIKLIEIAPDNYEGIELTNNE
jgi:hypothetical protein